MIEFSEYVCIVTAYKYFSNIFIKANHFNLHKKFNIYVHVYGLCVCIFFKQKFLNPTGWTRGDWTTAKAEMHVSWSFASHEMTIIIKMSPLIEPRIIDHEVCDSDYGFRSDSPRDHNHDVKI